MTHKVFPPLSHRVTVLEPGLVVAPDGSVVSTKGSKTSGIQEAVNYARNNLLNLHICGGAGTEYVYDEQLIMPAFSDFTLTADSAIHRFTEHVGSGFGILFDTFYRGYIRWPGIFIYQGSGQPFGISPRTPINGGTRFLQVNALFGTFVTEAQCGGLVYLDTSPDEGSSIHYSTLEFTELCANYAAVPVPQIVKCNAPNDGVSFLTFRCWNMHGYAQTAVEEGSANTDYVYGNRWEYDFQTAAPGSTLHRTYATFPRGNISCGHDLPSGSFARLMDYQGDADLAYFTVHVSPAEIPTVEEIRNQSSLNGNTTIIKNGNAGIAPVTVGASPFTWTNTLCRTVRLSLVGGSVSAVQIVDPKSNTLNAPTQGVFDLPPGYSVTVTYSTAPTVAYGWGD